MLHEFCFPSIFEIYPKTRFYRLPIHIQGAHKNFFHDPSLFQSQSFCQILFLVHAMQQRVDIYFLLDSTTLCFVGLMNDNVDNRP